MIRGIEGANIFGDGKDREHFLSRVSEITKATGTRPLAWTLIDNHVHLPGSPRRTSEVRAEIAYFLRRETRISMAEIERKLGVEASAMAIKRENSRGRQ
jgi:hypothetical protein